MWYTYIIRTHNNRLYTGITTDIERRWQEHCHGPKGARFFRTGKPEALCRIEEFPDRPSASRREAAIKKLKRREKDLLIATASPVELPKDQLPIEPQANYSRAMPTTSRSLCPDCHLPPPRCFCPWVTALDNPTAVVILQHPSEAKHAKNTAAFLAACLGTCEIWPGEEFGEGLAERLTQLPSPCLLYPDSQSLEQPLAQTLNKQIRPMTDNIESLIVLDATWRKSLKMLHLNPILSTLPRLSLPAPEARLYRIRKARNPHQLSTFEASCYALGHIENNTSYYQPGLAAFDRYMRQLASYRPQHPTGEAPANLRDAND